eukprot:Blabericola_migrator_1__8402@NODE_4379_length_1191_cov_5_064057_g2708_i0_p1_GENE_NODE_4379_length_1191_cov_5_064057_g2708_i0NODE_4379_length_1191_cov_5_064057_g2708_i0_p1_ORF_typecomplete_len131_score9_28_NODE_4379_length_1191_cov_5_064057_g2708_i0497889
MDSGAFQRWACVGRCFEDYDNAKYRAPTFTIVQASGTGKSRVSKEAGLLRPLPCISMDYSSACPRGSFKIVATFMKIKSEQAAQDALADLFNFAVALWEKASYEPTAICWSLRSCTNLVGTLNKASICTV